MLEERWVGVPLSRTGCFQGGVGSFLSALNYIDASGLYRSDWVFLSVVVAAVPTSRISCAAPEVLMMNFVLVYRLDQTICSFFAYKLLTKWGGGGSLTAILPVKMSDMF